MMIDRWKACGWRTNKQWRKEINEWWEITWITLKNNIKIMKKRKVKVTHFKTICI